MAKNKSMSDSRIDKSLRIAGTDFDRRRKVTKAMKQQMEQMYEAGNSYCYIASYFKVTPTTVKYNLDENFKAEINARRLTYAHNFPPTNEHMKDRVEYKKKLLENKNLRRAAGIPALI